MLIINMKIYTDYGNIMFLEGSGWIPKDISNRHYQKFLQEIQNGEAKLIPYVPPLPTWSEITSQRDQLLKETDWVVLPGVNISNKEEWLQYRQILRDITQIFKTPESVIWPIKPLLLEEV